MAGTTDGEGQGSSGSRPDVISRHHNEYQIVAIRTADDSDPTMYPVVGEDLLVAVEPLDGPSPQQISSTGLFIRESVNGKLTEQFHLTRIDVDVVVTDGRVAFASKNFDKGGGWFGFGGSMGSLMTTAAINAASRARAARRRRGKVLAGHIRYPWLWQIGFSHHHGLKYEQLRLAVVERKAGQDVLKLIDLTLPRDSDAEALAMDIVSRCARYRLQFTEPNNEARRELERLTSPERLQWAPGKFAIYKMPTYYRVLPDTAYPKNLAAGS